MKPLVIDVGGTHVKISNDEEMPFIEFDSSPSLTPAKLVQKVRYHARGLKFDRVSLGVPARVDARGRVIAEPGNLGRGWKRFDFHRAFGKPVRIMNDAAMQALGAYDGGRMLFLGLGTGFGSVIVAESTVVPLELGDLTWNRKMLSERVGRDAYYRLGRKRWRLAVIEVAKMLKQAFVADYVVLGGGKAGEGALDPLPNGLRAGGNEDAITGGYRMWLSKVEYHDADSSNTWRVLG